MFAAHPLVSARRLAVALSALSLVAGCVPDEEAPRTRTGEQAVVYDQDDRTDFYAVEDEDWQALMRESIVALVRPSDLDESDPNDIVPRGRTLQDNRDLCDDERFLDHPTMANCSGTLIDDDLVLTAGHCVDDERDCANYRFVFDYFYAAEGELQQMTSEDVYGCRALVARVLQGDEDWAVVQLDRPVDGQRRPAAVRRGDDALQAGDPITVIGFGSGIPAKFDDGGQVTNPRAGARIYFEGTPDTFGGNSGSGVFNDAREVVGVLVRGEADYTDDGDCTRVRVLEDGGEDGTEDMTYAFRAIDALCETDIETPLCDGRGGWCRPCAGDETCQEGFTCLDDPTTGVSYCSQRCDADDDCRSDHACVEGTCAPEVETRCVGRDVYEANACGVEIELVEACRENDFCVAGACVEGGDGNTCGTAVEVDIFSGGFEDVLVSEQHTDDFDSGCGGSGIDRVYTFTTDAPISLRAMVRGFDTVLSLRSECESVRSLIACNDDANPPGRRGSRVDADLDPGTYFLIVESASTAEGDIELIFEAELNCECEVGDVACDGRNALVCREGAGPCPTFFGRPCGDLETCIDGECVEAPEGDNCEVPFTLASDAVGAPGQTSPGYGDDTADSCGAGGPDAVHELVITEPSRLEIDLTASAGLSYSLRSGCESVERELACVSESETLEAEVSEGTYYVWVEGSSASYTLDVQAFPTCSDQCGPVGDVVCLDETTARECGQYDADSCLDFGPRTTCADGETCIPGEGCGLACEAGACVVGETRCGADGVVEVCTESDDGCGLFLFSEECASGVCEDGACTEGGETLCSDGSAPPCEDYIFGTGGGGGCAASGRAPALGWGVLLLAALGLRRRR